MREGESCSHPWDYATPLSRTIGPYPLRMRVADLNWMQLETYLKRDDRIVLPLDQQPFFSEKIIHLPNCYQANDATRIVPPPPSRAESTSPSRRK